MAADAGELKARATLDNTEFLSSLKDMVNQVNAQSQAAADGIGSITKAFGEMAEAAGLAEIAKQITDFAADCVDTARELSKLQAGFVAVAGSAEAANEVFESMKELGLNSMFDFAETLAPAAKNMMLMGASAETTTATMTALVDAAAGLKQSPQWITDVASTLANMDAHLVVNARDMKALTQEGIDGWGALATSLGVSISTAQEMVKKGMVTAQEATDAVTASLAGFNGASSLATTTWAGAMHVMSESGKDFEDALGKSMVAIENDFAPVLTELAQLVQAATEAWKGLNPNVQDVILALGAATPIVMAVMAAMALLATGLGEAALAAAAAALPIIAVVAAVALIGKWVYDEWPAIKAVLVVLWDEITEAWNTTIQTFVDWFHDLWQPLQDGIVGAWNGIKTAVGAVVDALGEKFNELVGWVKSVVTSITDFFNNIPGDSAVGKLIAAWNQGQQQIDATAAATKAATAAITDSNAAMGAATKASKAKEAQDLAAANAAKQAATEKKAADAEAAKAAADAMAYNASLEKTYAALNAIAPDVAQQFSDMYGGLGDDATAAQKVVGKAWDDLDTATQTLITHTVALGAAYKDLGVSSVASLQGMADKAEDAYTTIAASGTATGGDLTAAFGAVLAANQKVADQLNSDVKKAYADGKISADEYYSTIIQRAQDAATAASKALDDGEATNEDVAAKEQILTNARVAQATAQQTAWTTAMTAIGQSTQDQLDAASTKWSDYATLISNKLGNDAKPAIEATIKSVEAMIAAIAGMGQTPPDSLTQWLAQLNQKLTDMATPAERFAADMKTLGVTTVQDATDSVTKLATALQNAKDKSDGSLQSTADLQLGTQKLDQSVQSLVDSYNNKWQVALKAGDITQQQYNQHAYDGALQVLAGFTSLANDAPGKIQLVNAATIVLDGTLKTLKTGAMTDAQQAFKDLGVQSHDAMQQMATDAAADFAKVSASANENGTTYMTAWINAHKKIYDELTADGTSLSGAQKEDLAKMEQARTTWLAAQDSAWTTAYTAVSKEIGTTFDDMTKALITGDQSFGKLMTNLWQSLAETALNAFIAPLKKAITDFIANELANLLGDQGLGGVLTKLTSISGLTGTLFPSSGAAGGNYAEDIGGTGMGGSGTDGVSIPGIPTSGLSSSGGNYAEDIGGTGMGGAGDVASSGTDAASSASGGLSSALGGITGIVGAVGSVVSAVSGVISNFQMAHQTDILASIEHNTRYTMMYVGDRADGGILGVLFKINDEIAWGNTTKAVENHRDLFKDWSGPALAAMNGINDQLSYNVAPYLPDIKVPLQDIRTISQNLLDTVTTGFQDVKITINAGNLTTADAARQLGNQIATNLATQLTAVRG
jgi:hypothetical protein